MQPRSAVAGSANCRLHKLTAFASSQGLIDDGHGHSRPASSSHLMHRVTLVICGESCPVISRHLTCCLTFPTHWVMAIIAWPRLSLPHTLSVVPQSLTLIYQSSNRKKTSVASVGIHRPSFIRPPSHHLEIRRLRVPTPRPPPVMARAYARRLELDCIRTGTVLCYVDFSASRPRYRAACLSIPSLRVTAATPALTSALLVFSTTSQHTSPQPFIPLSPVSQQPNAQHSAPQRLQAAWQREWAPSQTPHLRALAQFSLANIPVVPPKARYLQERGVLSLRQRAFAGESSRIELSMVIPSSPAVERRRILGFTGLVRSKHQRKFEMAPTPPGKAAEVNLPSS
ncbi:hypothetical protein Landi51_10093 [Colletotrichum acutatum]